MRVMSVRSMRRGRGQVPEHTAARMGYHKSRVRREGQWLRCRYVFRDGESDARSTPDGTWARRVSGSSSSDSRSGGLDEGEGDWTGDESICLWSLGAWDDSALPLSAASSAARSSS